jgi:hypothetical protein
MKKVILTGGVAVIMFTAFLAKAQTTATQLQPQTAATTAATQNPNAPEIVFEKEVIDYGTVKYDSDGTREFKFKNTGKEPLIIYSATGSCGCTVPTAPKEPIKPGETGVIKVHYDTKRVGSFEKTVTVSSNAKTPSKILKIKGVVEPAPSTPATTTTSPSSPK